MNTFAQLFEKIMTMRTLKFGFLLCPQLKRPDEAAQQISSIVRKYPNYAEAHAALAAILWSQGKRARAEGELNAATTQEPRLGTMK